MESPSRDETEKKRDDALRRALSTPPKTQNPAKKDKSDDED